MHCRPAGPFIRIVSGSNILVDPDSTEADHSDANWMIIEDMISTTYLRAKFGKKNGDGGWDSIYDPTHVLATDAGGSEKDVEQLVNSFKLFEEKDSSFDKQGFASQYAYERAWRTRCAFVWDRVTRRLLLFSTRIGQRRSGYGMIHSTCLVLPCIQAVIQD
jgi:hypothetical protein